MPLRELILETQGDFNTHRIISGPKYLDGSCWMILATAPAQENAPLGWNGPVWNGVDIGSLRTMLRSLLEDRFKLAVHTEDRPIPGYALVAAKPRLRKADPSNRPGCREGPGTEAAERNWKDPRRTNPQASRPGPGTGGPVVDAAGIEGRYDLTVNFSPPSALANRRGGTEWRDLDFRSLEPQLGLKLQGREVPAPVLVIEHLEQNPAEN
jgi:uncharacterized protein (TIGR03435 family)